MAMERWRPLVGSTTEAFRGLSDIQGEVNRLFDSFFGRPAAAQGGRTWVPLIDVLETKDDLVLRVDLPGVHDKDVSVSITGDWLTIRGERRLDEPEAASNQYLHVERVYGKFERMVQLPVEVQADKVKATYRDGVLQITLPKAEAVKPKEVKIDVL